MRWYRREWAHVFGVLVALLGLHLATTRGSEPYFNNDEIRHTMTGVFFADAYRDLPASATHPQEYAVRYYCQYPALGLVSWPPLFYAIEGAAMLAFGPHFVVGRVCVAAFAALGLVCVYRFARLSLPHVPALLAVLWVGLTPVVFVFSQRVMLEVPCFALVLAAVVHFEHYLKAQRGRDAILCGLFAAAAVLTRFDAVLLLPYFGLRLLLTASWRLLGRRAVVWGVFLAVLVAAPYYLVTLKVYGGGLSAAATTGTAPHVAGLSVWERVAFYPARLLEQAGWAVGLAFVGGLAVAAWQARRDSGPAFALLVAVYATFTPLAEHDNRHAIYWLPAVGVFAAGAVGWVWRWKWPAVLLAVAITGGAGYEACKQAFRYVFGYEAAATWVVEHRTTDRPILADGEFSGSVVYHTRLHDPARRVWVLRGDKLIYSMFSDPGSGYKQHAAGEADVLAVLDKYDPEYLVIEDPPPTFHEVAGSELLRATLKAHPEKYEVAERVTVRSNYDRFTDSGVTLLIYRKLHRNPDAVTDIRVEVGGLGATLGATKE